VYVCEPDGYRTADKKDFVNHILLDHIDAFYNGSTSSNPQEKTPAEPEHPLSGGLKPVTPIQTSHTRFPGRSSNRVGLEEFM